VVTPYFPSSGTGQINAIFPVTPQTGASIPEAQANQQAYVPASARL
jgi:3,4-dihydroxyphenylacetate 2,3-dioxygenase